MSLYTDDLRNNPFRERFVFNASDAVYLDGNSLGRLPRETENRIHQVVRDEWGNGLISSWNKHWLNLSRRIGDKIGQIIGAKRGETIICDSTSSNLFKLAWGLLQHRSERNVIVTDSANFPSDLYVLDAVAKFIGSPLRVQALEFDRLDHDNVFAMLESVIGPDTALVSLSHVQFKSGYAFDMKAVNQLCRDRGAFTLWDLSHSVAAVRLDMSATQADAAVGCTYKYLNGGPGAPAFLFVRHALQESLSNPIAGWFGAEKPFEFGRSYVPNSTIERFLVGTPPILSTSAIEPGIDMVLEAGMNWLSSRSNALCECLIAGFDQRLSKLGYTLITPRSSHMRGSHVSFAHENGWQITQDLVHRYQIIPDFRTPNIVRFGIAPLYNLLGDVERALEALETSVVSQSYRSFSPNQFGVT